MAFAARPSGVLCKIWFDYVDEAELRTAIKSTLDQLSLDDEAIYFNDKALVGLVRRFQRFAAGQRDTFADLQIDDSHWTRFQKRVVKCTRAIPYGQTLSYGALAQKAGAPRAARAVGTVMANNQFPLVVPCHRVVASSQRIGGYSSKQGVCTKLRLLRIEGSLNEKGALTA